ncbi:MAG: SMI1/KNR4 family protein [Isosphaeraceae bacterium]
MAPPEMVGHPDEEGMAPWHPVSSPIDDELISGFEQFLGATLPPLFKEYLSYRSLLYVDLYEGTLPDIDPRRPLSWLEWCVRESRLLFGRVRDRLVPFTLGPAGDGVLCFDTHMPGDRGDYPVVIVPHAGAGSLKERTPNEWCNQPVFRSFESYLEFLRDWLTYTHEGPAVDFASWLALHERPAPPACYYGAGL